MNRHFRAYYSCAFRGLELVVLIIASPFLFPFACIGWARDNWRKVAKRFRSRESTDWPDGLFER